MKEQEPETPCGHRRWDSVVSGDSVEICIERICVQNGYVDLASLDGDVVWITMSLGERRLFHKDDGYELVKLDRNHSP